ncbi:hypothetical protein BH23ACT3_BH23ACT3_11670 [soil metagenome]
MLQAGAMSTTYSNRHGDPVRRRARRCCRRAAVTARHGCGPRTCRTPWRGGSRRCAARCTDARRSPGWADPCAASRAISRSRRVKRHRAHIDHGHPRHHRVAQRPPFGGALHVACCPTLVAEALGAGGSLGCGLRCVQVQRHGDESVSDCGEASRIVVDHGPCMGRHRGDQLTLGSGGDIFEPDDHLLGAMEADELVQAERLRRHVPLDPRSTPARRGRPTCRGCRS